MQTTGIQTFAPAHGFRAVVQLEMARETQVVIIRRRVGRYRRRKRILGRMPDEEEHTDHDESEPNSDSFHHAIGPVMASAQIFGLMPVHGVLSTTPASLEFRWRSVRMVYTVILLVSGLSFVWMALRNIMRIGIDAKNIGMIEGL